MAAILFIVVKALAESAWGTFAIAASIPIALLMGIYMYRIQPGRVGEASAIGVSRTSFSPSSRSRWRRP